MGIHWNGEITLGNVLSIGFFVGAAVFAYRDMNWRIAILEAWKETHLHTTEQQDLNISLLRQNFATLTALQTATDRRLILLEDRTYLRPQ